MSGENLDVDAEARTGAVIERNDRVIRDIVRRRGQPYEEIRAEVRRGAMAEVAANPREPVRRGLPLGRPVSLRERLFPTEPA